MDYTRRINGRAWQKLYSYLSDFPKIHTNNKEKPRRFVEAVFWIVRSGAPWVCCHRNTAIGMRYISAFRIGRNRAMLYYFAPDPDMEYIMVNSTILRTHACAAGAIKKNTAGRTNQH